RAGVNFNASKKTCPMGQQEKKKKAVVSIPPVRCTMPPQCVQTGVAKNDFPKVFCRRVACEHDANIILALLQKVHLPLLKIKKPSVAEAF
ncbi:MAG: hypothetical protein E7E73_06130, partial [Negativicoccus succinicivorans]|nr:hypothetical protein [Negativicoccus succinicivorans]